MSDAYPIVKPKSKRFNDIEGQNFGKLTVLSFAGGRRWSCRCDCGNEVCVDRGNLNRGHTESCGCIGTRPGEHGLSRSPEYRVWQGIKSRCFNPNNKAFVNYGGRGIGMYQEWIDSFQKFFGHVGCKPSAKHTLGRINNDGNYEPGNVRWETWEQQLNNTRRSCFVEFRGERLTVSQVARKVGVRQGAFAARLRTGMPIEEAISKPIKSHGNRHVPSPC